MVKCIECKQTKKKSEFYKDSRCTNRLSRRCKKCTSKYNTIWSKNHNYKYSKLYYLNHKKEAKEYHKIYYKNHRKEHRQYKAKARCIPKNKISRAIAENIRHCLKGRKCSRRWESIVSFTLQELKQHLESQFQEGMTWDNYGYYGWHIDHIIPISFFQYNSSDDVEFRMCWRLKNLRPLWATENMQKGNKLLAG